MKERVEKNSTFPPQGTPNGKLSSGKETVLTEEMVQNITSLKPERLKVKVAQSCPTVCTPVDYIVHEILQARILEWVAFPFFRRSSQPRDQTHVSRIAGRFFTS